MKKLGATILFWACSILAFILGFLVVIYIHENWPSLEAPAVFIFLALGIALGVIALRMRDSLAEKITGGASIACFSLSAGFAIFHGWGAEARMIYNVAVILFVLASLAFSIWLILRMNRSMRHSRGATPIPAHLGKPSEQAILADAAEPYILYPAKGKITRVLLIMLAITLLFSAATFWIFGNFHETVVTIFAILLAIFAIFCILECLALGYRLIAQKPAIIITSLGIIDRLSDIFDGAGPIRWEEVNHVVILRESGKFRPTLRYLAIVPENVRSFIRRRSAPGIFPLKLFSPNLLAGIAIYLPEFMLPVPLESVIEQIKRHTSHAIIVSDDGDIASVDDGDASQ
jgi:hypothetical protein